MTTVQSSTAAGANNAQSAVAAAASSAPSSTEIQDRFLKLLITQMKNQDPLNPLDNSQLTTQLAQISTVNGIEQLNTTMQSLSQALMAAQSLQAANLIGHSVVIDGNNLALTPGKPAVGGMQLDQAADNVKVLITSSRGDIVRQIDLGPQNAGVVGFQWDGLRDTGAAAAAGNYSFQIVASNGGAKVDATTLVGGLVNSVTLGSDGTHLDVEGVGDITMQQVKSIL